MQKNTKSTQNLLADTLNNEKKELKQKLQNLPQISGVYEYFDKNGRLLYVGKAKNLKKRVRSYFNANLSPNPKNSLRIQKMILQTYFLNYITTKSEEDALILENSLIKQLNPKYNILLKDDKTYPYICVDFNEDFPRLTITRRVEKQKNIKYFGPYVSGIKSLLDGIYMAFNLRQKQSCKKACLFYQLNRCYAPCEGKIGKEDYAKILKKAIFTLHDSKELINILHSKMLFHSSVQNYEQAGILRDMIKNINNLKLNTNIDLAKNEDFEICALYCEKNSGVCVRMIIQGGKVISVIDKKILNTKDCDFDEIYKSVILNFYKNTSVKKVYLNAKIEDLEVLLNALKIEFIVPFRGVKKRLVDLCVENAKNILKQNASKTLDEFFLQTLNIKMPQTIEIYDNSHIQGQANVGAMVFWSNDFNGGDFYRQNYRHYHLHSKNDYEQMREVLTRRIERFDEFSPPDLWLIDGGNALVNLAKELLDSFGANVDVLGIAKQKIDKKANRSKKDVSDIIYDGVNAFDFGGKNPNLQFFQMLRDEAHRFAISFHRKIKAKQDLASSNLEKMGISKANITKLIKYFGDFENIYNADFKTLCEVIGKKNAQKIKND